MPITEDVNLRFGEGNGSIIEKLKEMLEEYMKKTEPEYYPPVENLLDLIYEHYTENNPVEKNTVARKAAKAKEKELEEWLRGLDGMDRLVDDYKIPLLGEDHGPAGSGVLCMGKDRF